jgi:hypothetical protein
MQEPNDNFTTHQHCCYDLFTTTQTGMNIEQVVDCLGKYVKGLDSITINGLDIPKRSDGSEYLIKDLADDQQEALAEVVSRLKNYCEFKLIETDEPLRLTVSGVAGSGKSTWINTLVALVRQLFNNNESIGVYGPTGSAAFNAGGETINRGFRVPIDIKTMNINSQAQKYLLKRYSRTIIIVIDERSLLEANKLGCVEHFMAQCAHGGKNSNKSWGGIPIVILVGDDYQIPAIGYGAFYALEAITAKETKHANAAELSCGLSGFDEFRKFGKNVVYLDEDGKRVKKDQVQLRRILKALRCEDENCQLTEEDIQRLLALDINHSTFSKSERDEIQANSMYLFALKEPRDNLNAKMLLKANLQGNPVAKIKSKTINKHGKEASMASHFDNDRTPSLVQICKTAKVALNGCNISPVLGLYHSTLGVVEDIVYKKDESPNFGDMPAYVLVKFSQYCGKELIPGHRNSIPITPTTARCKYNCCTRTYIPLTLAYGRTVHTFQGQSVGPVPEGRPQNSIQRIIVEPGNRQFEGNNVGLLYTTASRPTTIGTIDDKMSSAMYFDGPDISRARITNLTREKSGRPYIKARLRAKWVNYLKDNSRQKREFTKEKKVDLFAWITDCKFSTDQLDAIITRNDNKEQ